MSDEEINDTKPSYLIIGGLYVLDKHGNRIITNNKSWNVSVPFGSYLEGFTAWRFPKFCTFCHNMHCFFYEEPKSGAVFCMNCCDKFGLNKD